MSHILVTGGAGYIGAHTCKALAGAGFTPVAYDNLVNGHRDAVRWGPLEEGDIADRARLDDVLARWRPQAAIHFAGYIEAGESMRAPLKFFDNNVGGSIVLLNAMAEAGIRDIVFSSSAAVYGDPVSDAIPETDPLAPINPYGHSKLMVEEILARAAPATGLRYAALRYFNAAGADPDGEIGERHDPETHLLPLAILAGLGVRDGFDIQGDDYPTPDGTAVRDFVHVADLASAHVAALGYLQGGGASDAFNVGTGVGISVLEAVEAVERAVGQKLKGARVPRRAGDPARLVAAPGKAKQLLGWQPKYAKFSDIVETAVAWHRRQTGGA